MYGKITFKDMIKDYLFILFILIIADSTEYILSAKSNIDLIYFFASTTFLCLIHIGILIYLHFNNINRDIEKRVILFTIITTPIAISGYLVMCYCIGQLSILGLIFAAINLPFLTAKIICYVYKI